MCIVNVINDTWKHMEIFELKGIAILALKSELSSKEKKIVVTVYEHFQMCGMKIHLLNHRTWV